MIELVAVENDGVELLGFAKDTDLQWAKWMDWIMDQNATQVEEGYDATQYRIVEADTRHCPSKAHSATHHSTECLATEWRWENLGR